MLSRKYGFLLFLLSFVEPTYANNKPPDLNASVIYVPTINVTPDEQTPNHVKIKIEQSMKQAIFTPYKKEGIPVASIVPFVVNFYILSEEDYRGH